MSTDSGPGGRVVALLGAESSGKSWLASRLTDALQARGLNVARVDEHLREFCDRTGRTPRREEQAAIAAEQTRRIQLARAHHELVIADTTALMTAVYSEQIFGDTALWDQAIRFHREVDLNLLTALDLPWQADGHQRDGAHVREPVDRALRRVLQAAGLSFQVVAGRGERRLTRALAAVDILLAGPPARSTGGWRHRCGRCGDADCEHRLFSRLNTGSA